MSVSNEEQKLDYDKARKGPQFAAALAASISAFILGNWLGWPSPIQPQIQDIHGTANPSSIWYLRLSDDDFSWIGSLILLGALVGSMMGGSVMDRWGRKRTLLVLAVPLVLAWFLTVVSVHVSMIFIACLVSGLCCGICSVVCPTYIGEISTPQLRGTLGFMFQLSLCFGMVFSSIMGLGLKWRLISAIMEVIPLVWFISVASVPESPVFLARQGRRREALQSLRQLRGPDFNIELELKQLEESLKAEMATVPRWSDLSEPWAYKPTAAAAALMFFVGLSGVNPASFNAVAIFNAAGSTIDDNLCAVILNVTQVVVNIAATFLTERMGRRLLFLISELICCVSMTTLGTYFYFEQIDADSVTNIGWLPLTSLVLFNAGFALGVGPVPWVMAGELVPGKIKGPAVSVATFANWFSCFLVAKTFIYIQEGLTRAGTFWLFGVFCLCGALFAYFLLPETKGKSPEEIQNYFTGRTSNSSSAPGQSPEKQN